MSDDGELELKRTVARWGEKMLTVSSVVDRVNGTAGNVGLAEEVAELRAGHRAAERERDQLGTKIDNLGESLRTELRAVSARVERSWLERWSAIAAGCAIVVAVLKWLLERAPQ